MKAKEFLMNDPFVSLKRVAGEMWPSNKGADAYISKKLNGALPWTENDEKNAIKALRKFESDLKKVTE